MLKGMYLPCLESLHRRGDDLGGADLKARLGMEGTQRQGREVESPAHEERALAFRRAAQPGPGLSKVRWAS